MLKSIITTILGDENKKYLKKIQPLVEKINEKEKQYQEWTDEKLKQNTELFKERIKKGESLDDLLVEAFATVKNACRRMNGNPYGKEGEKKIWDMIPYDCQLIGGITLHQGKIAEMKTGEGKTLVASMPVYLNALTEKGVHVITVNDYLAKRDAEWIGNLYGFLGLTVGVVAHGISNEERKEAYSQDITYGTNNEFGFDYLRDNMVTRMEQRVQRSLAYAVVDEIDSILIDESRTPLIISAAAESSTSKYQKYSQLVNQLQNEKDYLVDEKAKTATLTEEGIAKMEKLLGVDNIYHEAGFLEVHHIEQALKAQAIFQKDKDYLVKEDQIIIIDEFTGRLMPGRRYSDGLHQAIEAKEKVEIKRESKTLATVTFQNYFRLYEKLSGMTGTAKTEEEEFFKIYGLETVVIPTNKPVVRKDLSDLIYKSQKGKYEAIVQAVKNYHEKGQPVLVGTISVEKSELLSKLLKLQSVPHEVLNAKNHAREAEIVSKAGAKGAVTIATNMAGRGTDIKLGEGVKDLGGLVIIGTERHDSRRIDNQLRGRSGRQGDPGESRFYVSMEDDLMRLFGADRIKNMMEQLGLPEDMPIENRLITKSIESAQKRVEGHNFDIRKHLLEYDDVMNKHREIIYEKRLQALEKEEIKDEILEFIENTAETMVQSRYLPEEDRWDTEGVIKSLNTLLPDTADVKADFLEKINTSDEINQKIKSALLSEYAKKESDLPDPKMLREVEKRVYLRVIDALWMEHIDNMTNLRQSVALRGYGQRNPLSEYKQEAYLTFKRLLNSIKHNVVNTLFKVQINWQNSAQNLAQNPSNQNLQTNQNEIEGQLNPSSGAEKRVAAKFQAGDEKIKPNDPCPCGSGKKYKKCCGKV